ncbi:MAG: ABC transporter permease, partial [Myxococcota bacterium]
MLRHWLVATWRLLKSDRSFSLITILSLALGCGAAVLVGAYLHEELSYDRWIEHHEDIGRVEMEVRAPGQDSYGAERVFCGLGPLVR